MTTLFSGSTIASLLVRIGTDLSSFNSGMNQVSGSLRTFGSASTRVGSTLTKGLTLPIIGVAAACIKTAADFEAGMSSIKAVSGATGKEMQQLEALALKAGADTKYSAKEAAAGIEELIKAGVSVTDILNGGLMGALNLAAAGDLELADSAEIASTVLNAFRKDALSVAQAADILAGAANASATDVGELKYGLSMVSAVASGVGLSFKDTATGLAVFAQNGLKGSDAGTSLKTMLLNLSPTTDKATKMFAKFGLVTKSGSSIFYDAKGNLKGLGDIADILKTKLGGLNAEARQQALKQMFGTDAIRAANILFNEGAVGVQKMQDAMMKVKAADVANEKMNNLKGSIEQLKGSIETLMIVAGKAFLPYLKKIADAATQLVNSFMNLSPETKKMIMMIVGIAAVAGPLLMIIGGIANGISGLVTVIGMLASPVGLVIAGIVALVAFLIYLWNTNKKFKDGVLKVWNFISKGISSAISGIMDFWNQYGDQILTGIINTFKAIWEFLKPILQVIGNSIGTLLTYVQPIWESLCRLFWTVVDVLKQLWPIIQPIIIGIGAVIAVMAAIWVGKINAIIKAIGPFINCVVNLANMVASIIGFVVALITGDWDAAWKFLVSAATSAWEALKSLFDTIVKLVSGFVEGVIGFFKGLWYALVGGSIVPDIVNGVLACFTQMIDGALSFAGRIKDVIVGAFNGVKDTVVNMGKSAVGWGKKITGGIADGVASGANKVKNAALDVAGSIGNFLGFHSPTKEGPGSTSDQWMPNLMSMMTQGILKGVPQIQSSLSGVFQSPISTTATAGMVPATATSSNGTQNVVLSGRVTIVGVNNKGEFVAAADYIAGEINSNSDRFAKSPSIRRTFKG